MPFLILFEAEPPTPLAPPLIDPPRLLASPAMFAATAAGVRVGAGLFANCQTASDSQQDELRVSVLGKVEGQHGAAVGWFRLIAHGPVISETTASPTESWDWELVLKWNLLLNMKHHGIVGLKFCFWEKRDRDDFVWGGHSRGVTAGWDQPYVTCHFAHFAQTLHVHYLFYLKQLP